ncbi:MAG: DUF3604 domain-containing protein [Oceanicoccus sp.]
MNQLHRISGIITAVLAVGIFSTGCTEKEPAAKNTDQKATSTQQVTEKEQTPDARSWTPDANRVAYFGDLHVHTTYSFDAFSFGSMATPHDAYRYARGETIKHPAGFDLKLDKPLDFYAVTDHAMYLGVSNQAADTTTAISKLDASKPLNNLNAPDNFGIDSFKERTQAFRPFIPKLRKDIADGKISSQVIADISKSAWADTIKAAQDNYVPGEFTTFIGYEFTTAKGGGSMHRNVIFRGSDNIPDIPFSRINSENPEDLWEWMDAQRAKGAEALAIPHNSNGSAGHAFELTNWAGEPISTEYTEMRARNEPLVEITQVKGTSETHPSLSMNDEWAGFEIAEYSAATYGVSNPPGSYVREALINGLSLEEQRIGNPFKFGVIGSSDTHVGAGPYDEANYFSKVGLFDGDGIKRGSIPIPKDSVEDYSYATLTYKDANGRLFIDGKFPTWGAAGLAGVWAEENTRESIYDGFRRKEVFATSGPRIRVRFFGGFDFDESILEAEDIVTQAYQKGVPMGSDLIARDAKEPSFLLWALRDSDTAPLQRLQIIKAWLEDGQSHEQVFDVACTDGLTVDPVSHRCPDNNAKVNITDCAITADTGASELKTLWKDPEFNAEHRAFYYVRVLENPTCRWSTWDAVRAGTEPRDNLNKTIQERAWSSPIWYAPRQ